MAPTHDRDLPARFLGHLRAELRHPGLAYAAPPAPMAGGYDTQIFSFRLSGAPAEWSGPLVLRLLGSQHDPRRAVREEVVQNTVAGLGYPAPRALLASADPVALGGGFLVMERISGRPMLEERRLGVAARLVHAQIRLHALDAGRLLEAMDGIGHDVTFDGLLTQFRDRIARESLDGLRSAVDWLASHRPPASERPVICHGDFHPQNILTSAGALTGVLDWPNTVVADAAYDVASTRIILGLVPLRLSAMPAPVRMVVRMLRPVLLRRYLAGYRRRRPLRAGALAYYEAASCMRPLIRATEGRRRAAVGGVVLDPLDASSFAERVCARFARITGVTPTVPGASGGPGSRGTGRVVAP
jgi:aminoglycoside phosphotransferase (APT) family kinase protein